MERRRFGPIAVEIPVVGQGTWYIDKANRGAAVAALRRGLDLGMTHIDTAEYYGEAENIVGEAIAGRRADVFLVSKVVPEHATRAGVIAACEHSLARLKPIGSTATCCTGAANIPWRIPSQVSNGYTVTARSDRLA